MSSYNNHGSYGYGYGGYPPNDDGKSHQQPYNTNYGYSYQNAAPQNMAQQPPYPQQSPSANSVPFGGAADFLGPDLLSNPAAQIGLHVGSQALSAGQSYVNRNLGRWISIPLLREYFSVTNSYVMRKILLIMFPFVHKRWQRNYRLDPTNGQVVGYLCPKDDLNAPDLYIPIMALVTYIIMVGFIMGVKKAFHPEQLGVTATSCMMALGIEVLLIKLGCYILTVGEELHALDFMALAGYKFCIMIASTAARQFGTLAKYSTFLYCSVAYGMFLIRSLRPMFVPEDANTLVVSQRRRRINFLLSVTGMELLISYILLK